MRSDCLSFDWSLQWVHLGHGNGEYFASKCVFSIGTPRFDSPKQRSAVFFSEQCVLRCVLLSRYLLLSRTAFHAGTGRQE